MALPRFIEKTTVVKQDGNKFEYIYCVCCNKCIKTIGQHTGSLDHNPNAEQYERYLKRKEKELEDEIIHMRKCFEETRLQEKEWRKNEKCRLFLQRWNIVPKSD